MPASWRERLETFGSRGPREGHYMIAQRPFAARRDAWPKQGAPGSDLDLMREQLLDRYGLRYALLGTVQHIEAGSLPRDLSVAMTTAINDWTRAEFLEKDQRLLSSIHIPYEYPDAAVAEIGRLAGHPQFVSALINGRTEKPLGNPKYWSIYEAAEAHDLPIGVHVAGTGANLITGVGIPASYLANHAAHVQDMQSHLISLVYEGVFERFPRLRVVLIEGGFSWVGPLKWRLDRSWELLRDEVPHLRRRPSEYVHDHFWFTTQPIEEPTYSRQLAQVIRTGELEDRLMFSTDYPHWDFDAPDAVLAMLVDEDVKRKIRYENARSFLKLA
jgi:predicted TIM-barrel fold metal-dependent hydrolase